MVKSGYFIGLNHGHVVSVPKENPNHRRDNTSNRKGRTTKRNQAIRSLVQEIAGFSPYERKIIEMLRTGDAIKEKKAMKMARRKLGRQFRARRKIDNMQAVLKAQRKK